MFAPPPRRAATVFAQLPNELRTATAENEWNAGQPAGLAATAVLEGLSFDRDGLLWCVDIVNGRVYTVDAQGRFKVELQYDGWPNGLKIHRDGRIFVADYKHGILVFDREKRRMTPVLERYHLERLKAVNDLFFAANGDLYFTDQGMTGLQDPTGRLFCLRKSGELVCLLNNIPSPNGLVMDLEERSVFVAVTRENSVWRMPLGRDGMPIKVARFLQLSGGVGPDCLALDKAGGLVVAHPGLGCLWRFDSTGEPTQRIDTPAGKLTLSIAFGGAGAQDVFFTESSTATILRAPMPVAGKAMYSHA
ncbi:MAG: SMP-30/gluconolactonase/LRE family protein [Pseudomonadota bacterium]